MLKYFALIQSCNKHLNTISVLFFKKLISVSFTKIICIDGKDHSG